MAKKQNTKKKGKSGMHHQHHFYKERRAALNSSIGDEGRPSFMTVLQRHALLSIDTAYPDTNKSYYIKQGRRLAAVQQKWIDTINAVLPQSDDWLVDRSYLEAVTESICSSTDTLMHNLVDGTKTLNWEEIGYPLEQIHKNLSQRAEQNAGKTRQMFQTYFDELQNMYTKKTEDSYYVAARRALASANLLGAWLDSVCFY